MAPQSSILALKIPWTEEPGWLQSMGSLRVGHDWVTSLSLFTFMHWRRKWQPTPVFLPGESQGWGSLVGCHLWGHTESDMTEVTKQQSGVQTSSASVTISQGSSSTELEVPIKGAFFLNLDSSNVLKVILFGVLLGPVHWYMITILIKLPISTNILVFDIHLLSVVAQHEYPLCLSGFRSWS